jgi:thiol-disulfide isomerase/thioredoxin
MLRKRATHGVETAVCGNAAGLTRCVFGFIGCALVLAWAIVGCSTPRDAPPEPPPPPTPEAGTPPPSEAGSDANAGTQTVAVTFTKPGCPACIKLEPVLATLKTEYADKVRFDYVDTSVHKEAVIECGITGTPTVIIYVNKKEFKNMLNPREKELRESLEAALAAKG